MGSGRQKERYSFQYQERMECLSYNGVLQSLTMILISQLIYFNLHFAIGATITALALLGLVVQVTMSFVERRFLRVREKERLNTTLDVHFCFNRGYLLLYMPFLVWTVVLMYERIETPTP